MNKPANNRREAGYFSLPLVTAMGLAMLSSMLFAYSRNVRSQDVQARSQLRVDYAQKEDAILRSLVNIVPNKAIGAMKRDSASTAGDYTWSTIFEEAIDLADADQAIDSAILSSLGSDLRLGNTGDATYTNMDQLVSPVAGSNGLVNAGNSRDGTLLSHSLYNKMPAPLVSNNSNFNKDKLYPIITNSKRYSNSYRKGVLLDADAHPRFNQLIYPNIQFGYARPGDTFVAKRNWWAFSLKFGEKDSAITGAPVQTKNYVLSIYEIPSQLPLSAGAIMSVGRHEDGTDWSGVTMDGGLFAGTLETEGTVAVTNGALAARNTMILSGDTSVEGNAVNANIDQMGVREAAAAETDTDFFNTSLGGNVGRAAFLPLSRGNDFFALQGDGSSSLRLSPTGWNSYSTGGVQCDMRVRVREMESDTNQRPIMIRFQYRLPNNSRVYTDFTRGDNWPYEDDPGGDAFPFQTEYISLGRNALVYHPERMPAFLASLGAGDITINESVYIYPDSSQATVNPPAIPSTSNDLAIVVRSCRDLTPYTNGFSLVTNCRLYIGESFNLVPTTVPANSGLPSSSEFYPPVSLFAPEKRYGTSTINHQIKFHGQLSSLKDSSSEAYRPLDMRSGSGETVEPSKIDAELKSITSPSELPPIRLMNWLVTVQEINP